MDGRPLILPSKPRPRKRAQGSPDGEREARQRRQAGQVQPKPAPLPTSANAMTRQIPWKLIGILTPIILTATGIVMAIYLHDSPTPIAPASLRILSVDVHQLVQTDFDVSEPGTQLSPAIYKVPSVDVTLRNEGGQPALIKSIDVRLRFAKQMEPCAGGAGPLRITGHYTVSFPAQLPPLPFQQNTPTEFGINPTSNDRLSITLGPQGGNFEADGPWLYGFDLTFTTVDAPLQVSAGTVELASATSDKIAELSKALRGLSVTDIPCLKRNLLDLTNVSSLGGKASLDLSRLRNEYQARLIELGGH
jgi:hypothetical protein